MRLSRFAIALCSTCLAGTLLAQGEKHLASGAQDPLASWRNGVNIHEVSPDQARHSIHSYFNTCPESPDGKTVLFYTSTDADAGTGEVRIRDRSTGVETALKSGIRVEDAHRVACQQWVSQGRRVVFHGEFNGEWQVHSVELATGNSSVLATGRLSGWGQPGSDLVPLYGPHWNPGPHDDLELVDARSGQITTVLPVEAVQKAYPDWLAKTYGDKPVSIFFPVLSPDMSRVFFKMASPAGGIIRSSGASERQGLICYDLAGKRFLYMNPRWGHPSWHPDGQNIVETNFTLYDSNTGKPRRTPGLPAMRGDHPSASPDGRLLVTDTTMDKLGGNASEWGVVVGDARGSSFVVVHRFQNERGAKSWRRSHPHPVFSPDGQRIYYNVSDGPWTRLHVAISAPASP